MRCSRTIALRLTPVLVVAALPESAAAGSGCTVPWVRYVDPASGSVCDVVNAANLELVVLEATGELVAITGTDVVYVDTFVDADGSVFFQNSPAGFVEFAEDGDGFRTLWWFAVSGDVVHVDPLTGEPQLSGFLPGDFTDVPCDACPFWDDPSVCTCGCTKDSDCDDSIDCTDDLCVGEKCTFTPNDIGCPDDGDPCTRAVCDTALGCLQVPVVDERIPGDLDCDTDIDLGDYAIFQRLFTGPSSESMLGR